MGILFIPSMNLYLAVALLIIGLVIICHQLFEGVILSTALRKGNAIEKGKM